MLSPARCTTASTSLKLGGVDRAGGRIPADFVLGVAAAGGRRDARIARRLPGLPDECGSDQPVEPVTAMIMGLVSRQRLNELLAGFVYAPTAYSPAHLSSPLIFFAGLFQDAPFAAREAVLTVFLNLFQDFVDSGLGGIGFDGIRI